MAQLECKNLSLGYETGMVINRLNFRVDAGEYLCIEGENGAGKSTLLKAILGLKKPVAGDIIFDGVGKGEIGYLPQQTQVQKDFPASVMEVVLSGFAGSGSGRIFHTKAEKTEALEKLKRLGIEELSGRCYRELSGGQQQRVLLARAICGAKKILILDEPVAGLDPSATENMYSIIRELNENDGITIIMVSHDVQVASGYATHILRLTSDGYEIFRNRQSKAQKKRRAESLERVEKAGTGENAETEGREL